MIVCGLKLTHDGGVAVVDAQGERPQLLFSIEAEKVANAERHASLADLALVERLLEAEGVGPDDIDVFVVDGWGRDAVGSGIKTTGPTGAARVTTAPYRQDDDDTAPLHRYVPVGKLVLGGRRRRYASYRHADGHLAGAYMTSPAAAERRPAFVLVWDGGTFPELYHVDPATGVEYLGALLRVRGEIYSGFASRFPPFVPDRDWDDVRKRAFHLSVPGKAMAYAGLAGPEPGLVEVMRTAMAEALAVGGDAARGFAVGFARRLGDATPDTAEVLASFQAFMADLLVSALAEARHRSGRDASDLCFAGGCALNIKWNSALRASGLFERVWVPPFPNDSGSALGTACAELFARRRASALSWSVYCGPAVGGSGRAPGWTSERCSIEDLAALLAESEEPVVTLLGRAEAGPRALGHRSILAAPFSEAAKGRLNAIKDREPYRPVSPICLEERSTAIFEPGTPDPHMLFDHQVRAGWAARIPAVVHADGTARLQTVSERQCPHTTRLLKAFEARSAVPVLCNTSANLAGRGFFPDAASALAWGRVERVWADGTLYVRQGARAAAAGPH